MGYRSDVAYVIKFESIEHRDAFVTLMHAKNTQIITQALNEVGHDDDKDPVITAYFGDVKWYEGYPDVQVHHMLMNQAQELYNASYRFVRVGEDANDVEVQETDEQGYDLWEYVEPITTIRRNF